MPENKTFRVPLPKTGLEFTGERFTTLVEGEVRHEHLHRYFFALQFCAGKSVLDIASGEGYGTAVLAQVAGRVTGVDVSGGSIRHATENYPAPNLSFLQGEATQVPVAASCVDVVVSFETLEHMSEQVEFLLEIRRVLRPGGLLVMSTPDHEFFADSPPNPFHLKELVRTGFRELIGRHFKNSVFFLQSSLMGSVIAPDRNGEPAGASYEGFRRVLDNVFESAPSLPNGMYMIAVASDALLPEVRTGSFDDRGFQLGLYAELQRRHIEVLNREADVEGLRSEKNAAAEREAQYEAELLRNRDRNLRLEAKIETLEKQTGALRQRELERETALQRSGEELHRVQAETERLDHENRVLQQQAAEMETALQRSGEELHRVQAESERLRQENKTLREHGEKVEAESRRRSGDLLHGQAENENLKKEIGALLTRESEAIAEGRRLRDRHTQIETESAATIGRLTGQRDALRQEVAASQAEADALKRSWSWWISAPLRWLGVPASKIRARAIKLMYGPPAFRYTGKPLAKLLSNVSIPGAGWLLPENPLFDAPFYRERYPDVANASKNLWAHYLSYGCDESRDPHPSFKSASYKIRYPDVAAAGVNPLVHYFEHGAREGRDPSTAFDSSYYLEHYPDVRESGLNPLLHFMRYGKAEGRRASAGPIPAAKTFLPTPVSQAQEGTEPLLSILMPTYNTPPGYLRLAIESVLRQSYRGWQLCIHDDGSSAPETLEALKNYQGRDPRIRIEFGAKNEGIARATNHAISLASGKYIAMLDHDDEIVPEALLEVSYTLNADPSIDALYTDQAYIDADGGSLEPFYKPDWSPDMFRGVMFVGHLLVVRRSLAVELGGFDAYFDRAQDFEFMLRVAEKTSKIYHLPKILYYWRRIPGSVAFDGNQKGPIEPIQSAAVNAHLARLGIPAVAEAHPVLSHRLVIKPSPRTQLPTVQVVVREASSTDPNSRCIASILERSTYSNFKLVTAQPPPPKFAQDRRVEVSNPSHLDGGPESFVIWIDSALEVLTPDWIEHLLLYCEQPQIACATPLIVKEDCTVWHSGLILGMNGTVDYPMQGWPSDSDGYAGSLSCAREVSCVSGECMMVSRLKLEGLGGLVRYYEDSMFEGADLSLRAYVTGLRNIVTPQVVLRKLADSGREEGWDLDRALFTDRWGELSQWGDRFYNPNFSPASPGYQVKKTNAAAR